jgi:hypothetical protein
MSDQKTKSMYDYGVKDAPDDLLINCSSSAIVMPSDGDQTSQIKLMPGDRVLTPKYADQLVGKVPGLCRLNALNPKHAAKLEHERRVRTGEEPDDYTKEARSRLGKAPETDALAGDDELSRAVNAARSPQK